MFYFTIECKNTEDGAIYFWFNSLAACVGNSMYLQSISVWACDCRLITFKFPLLIKRLNSSSKVIPQSDRVFYSNHYLVVYWFAMD